MRDAVNWDSSVDEYFNTHSIGLPRCIVKKQEIKLGGIYVAKVGANITEVRVDAIREGTQSHLIGDHRTRYDVTNLKTGRKTVFSSAMKFRSEVKQEKCAGVCRACKKFVDVTGDKMPTHSNAQFQKCCSSGLSIGSWLDRAVRPTVVSAETPAKTPTTPPAKQTVDTVGVPTPGVNVVTTTSDNLEEALSNIEDTPPTITQDEIQDLFGNDISAAKSIQEERESVQPEKMVTSSTEVLKSEPPFVHGTKSIGIPGNVSVPTVVQDVPVVKASGIGAILKQGLQSQSPDNAQHIIVMARAGTGKTTTGEEGLKAMRGMPTRITPSVQQQVIWDEMVKSTGSVGFTAFGKDIATEVQERLQRSGLDKRDCEGMTTHSMGFKAVRNAFTIRSGKDGVNGYVVQDYLADILHKDSRQMKRDTPVLVNVVDELVGLCKQTLTPTDPESLSQLVRHYGIEFEGAPPGIKEQAFDLVPQVLERCKNPEGRGQVDFNDMIWLPVVHKLPNKVYDLLIVDEQQDLNRARQEIVKMYGRRIMGVGDDRQAIFGFAGADDRAMANMQADLTASSRGCKVLPLTVTRRCGKAIVQEAQQYVPDFRAHDSNPEGRISYGKYPTYKNMGGSTVHLPEAETYLSMVNDGDRILCRCNAPLISQYFKLIKMGKDATILGRDIANGLIKLIDRFGASSIKELISAIHEWQDVEIGKEQAQKNPSESRIDLISDKATCLLDFTQDAQTVQDVKAKMDQAFADKRCPRCKKGFMREAQQCWACKVSLVTPKGVQLSSIHKSKGLEARHVFWLRLPGIGPREDKMKAWELRQEENLRYVATTRAIEELTYVS